MTEIQIKSAPFVLTSFQRLSKQGEDLHVYIEGDGLAWMNKRTPSLDPSPTDPVALKLATKDPSYNVVYLARPCQYTKMSAADQLCDQKYWTSARFAPEIVQAINNSISDIKKDAGASSITITGFSGGGGIAALVTAERDDVKLLRTVAGNLDPDKMAEIHNISPLDESLNPADISSKIAHVPQIHFIGTEDKIITSEIASSYRQASRDSSCITVQPVKGVSHDKGWNSIWPTLLHAPVKCREE